MKNCPQHLLGQSTATMHVMYPFWQVLERRLRTSTFQARDCLHFDLESRSSGRIEEVPNSWGGSRIQFPNLGPNEYWASSWYLQQQLAWKPKASMWSDRHEGYATSIIWPIWHVLTALWADSEQDRNELMLWRIQATNTQGIHCWRSAKILLRLIDKLPKVAPVESLPLKFVQGNKLVQSAAPLEHISVVAMVGYTQNQLHVVHSMPDCGTLKNINYFSDPIPVNCLPGLP